MRQFCLFGLLLCAACDDAPAPPTCANLYCDPVAICSDVGGAPHCACPAGYGGDGTTCTDIDECAADNGGCDALTTCTNTPGARTCSACPSGYSGTGAAGCVDVDECLTALTCDPLTTCTNSAGSFSCSACPSGYSGDGKSGCVDIDECATGAASCDAHAACANSAGAYTCACSAGYTGTGKSCAPCQTCAPGTHETGACTATVDRVCSACSTCVAGQYETGACSATSDRVCSACAAVAHCAGTPTCSSAGDSQCAACASNFYLVDGVADTCAACSGACPGGQYQSAACSATADRVCSSCASVAHCASAPMCTSAGDSQCAACDPTYYLVDGTADTCAACSGACAGGQYQSAACSAGADRVCSSCTTCVAGQYESGACTTSSNRTCSACTAVAHCAGTPTCTSASDSQCSACASNFYLVDGVADSCAACSGGCSSGQYQSAACSATADRVCSSCTAVAHCASAPTCSAANNSQCAACDATYYLVDGSADTCSACSGACPGGQYQSAACSAAADRVCSSCAVCGAGTYEATACTPTSNTVCTACPTHCTSCTSAAACSACDPGYFGATCQNVRSDCNDILSNGESVGDGIYVIDPDGAGGAAPIPVYCDMTHAGGGWTQLNDQDVAFGYLPAATWLTGVNNTAPNGGQWGILNRLGQFANGDGSFDLRLTFGQAQSTSAQWTQSANPLSGAPGTLSNVVMSPPNQMGCSIFLGEAARSSFAALDGDTLGCWWFAVGSSMSYVGPPGIPAYANSDDGQLVTDRTRFWVRKHP